MLLRSSAPLDAPVVAAPAAEAALVVVLEPLSHPELGAIRVDDELFAIGRDEPPFAGYPRELVAGMSRRHARLFTEHGAAYVADLGSKNGTTVNGAAVREKPLRLREGDRLGLGGELAWRVHLESVSRAPARRLVGLTLTPERGDLGLEPIVLTQFPFLVSKSDDTIARHREAYPQEVNYVSRRHAHLFLKGGVPYVEDLGSANGTFVGGRRLDEHAVELHDGDVVAFGGRHFVYRVSLQQEREATLTRVAAHAVTAEEGAQADKTTFVAAADSFLDIFCIDAVAPPEDEVNAGTPDAPEAAAEAARPRRRARWAVFLDELGGALGGDARAGARRLALGGGALVAVVAAAAGIFYLRGAPERDLRALLAQGRYAEAAVFARGELARHPDDEALAALATSALLKARVPEWLARVNAGDFDGAAAVVRKMREGAASDAAALVAELAWITELERFVVRRGGVEAPIRIDADEAPIEGFVHRWRADPRAHQRALARIATEVPAFGDAYARALSHLRKLESDDAVYVAAIERLKTEAAAARAKGDAAALDALLRDYAEKYPRLAGLESLRGGAAAGAGESAAGGGGARAASDTAERAAPGTGERAVSGAGEGAR